MRRMLPIALHLQQKATATTPGSSPQHDLFFKRIGAAYCAFVEEQERVCRSKCLEDLEAVTRFVTWSMHDKKPQELARALHRVRSGLRWSLTSSYVNSRSGNAGLHFRLASMNSLVN